MKILFVTSRLARPLLDIVLKEVEGLTDYRVFELSVPVASLATTSLIAKELSEHVGVLKNLDLIVIPGLSIGSAREVESRLGVRTLKGPRYLGDLPEMIKQLKQGFDFSTEVPADDVMQGSLTNYYREKISGVILSREPLFTLKNVKFTETPPPLNLFYEHLTSAGDELKALLRKLSQLKQLGYEGVVIGCEVECKALEVVENFLELTSDSGFLAGVDLIYESIPGNKLKDLLALSDLVFNVSSRNLDVVVNHLRKDQGVVVIPTEFSREVKMNEDITRTATSLEDVGVRNILVDVVVKPPMLGFVRSLLNLREAKRKLRYPLLFSPANVYELMDVDTPGVVALLVDIGFELGVSSMLITESSVKARNVVFEASVSRELIYRAFIKMSPPINQGVDLLLLKEKRGVSVQAPLVSDSLTHVIAGDASPKLDQNYYVKIYVDLNQGYIIADVYRRASDELLKRYVGRKALEVGRTLVREYEMLPDHVLYLGYELSKAEAALKLGKSYVQDEDLFREIYSASPL
ncbi:MAG: dihydropteroate synthase-like protein [Zestosphaera sp.]